MHSIPIAVNGMGSRLIYLINCGIFYNQFDSFELCRVSKSAISNDLRFCHYTLLHSQVQRCICDHAIHTRSTQTEKSKTTRWQWVL